MTLITDTSFVVALLNSEDRFHAEAAVFAARPTSQPSTCCREHLCYTLSIASLPSENHNMAEFTVSVKLHFPDYLLPLVTYVAQQAGYESIEAYFASRSLEELYTLHYRLSDPIIGALDIDDPDLAANAEDILQARFKQSLDAAG